MTEQETVEVHINLLEEGSPTLTATQAIPLGNDIYKLLPSPYYDPEDAIWEFVPGDIVRCEYYVNAPGGIPPHDIILAVEKVG